MAGSEKLAEKVPGWVERLLIPTLESRVRTIVKEEVNHLEKTMNARFEAIDVKFDAVNGKIDSLEKVMYSKFDDVSSRIESLERRIPVIQDIADLKARLAVVEKQTAG